SLAAIANKEQIAERCHLLALLSLAQQRRHRHAEELPQQVEERGFQGRDRVNGRAQIEGLLPTSAAIPGGKGTAHAGKDVVVSAERLPQQQRLGVLDGLANGVAARD